MKKVAVYVRVSTQEQEKEGYSIPAQREKLLAYCKAKDWLVKDIYIDGGYSGGNINRPALERLLSDLNDIDIVLVYKLDRLSRRQKDTLLLIEDNFLVNDVDFVSVTENFDTTSPFGRAMIGILSVFAQLERDNIKDRTTMGRIERAKKGLWAGAPNPPIGYDLIDSNLVVNDYEALQVKEIFDLYIKGYGMQKIQNVFRAKGYTTKYGDWDNISTHTITRIIANRTYIGEISYAKKWYKGIHTPLIDVEIFDKANTLHSSRKGEPRAIKYFLSGLLYCGECGAKYTVDKKGNRSIYVCRNRKYGYKQDFKCTNKIFTTTELEQMAIDKLKALVKDKGNLYKDKYNEVNKVTPKNDNKILENRIDEIDNQINKLMDLYQVGTIPVDVLSGRIEKLYDEKKSISLEKETDPIIENINIDEILEVLSDFDTVWDELEVEQKKEIASLLMGNKIIVNESGV